jgi:hypothetical protein
MATQVQPLTKAAKTEQPRREDRAQRPKPLTDFYGEGRHELVQKPGVPALGKKRQSAWVTGN